jgi:hypothetical protein
MDGYKPSPLQRAKCRRCYYWMPWDNSSNHHCCHYMYITGHRRGPDPCDKWEPKPTSPVKRKVKPALLRKDIWNDKN